MYTADSDCKGVGNISRRNHEVRYPRCVLWNN